MTRGAVTLRSSPPSNGSTHWHAQHRRHCRRSEQTTFSATSSANPPQPLSRRLLRRGTPGLRSAARRRGPDVARENHVAAGASLLPRTRRGHTSKPSSSTRTMSRRTKGEESIERLGRRRNKKIKVKQGTPRCWWRGGGKGERNRNKAKKHDHARRPGASVSLAGLVRELG